MFRQKLSTEQRLSKAVVKILSKDRYVALAGVLMIGKKEVVDDIPTACTDGRDEKYGRKFVDGLNDAELRGLVLHENYHKLYRHMITWKHLWAENPHNANMAMDFVINLKIRDENKDGFANLPDGGCIDEKYRGMNTKQVFDLLQKSTTTDRPNGDGSGGGSFDEHDFEGADDIPVEDKAQLARDIDAAIRQGALSAGKMGAGVDRDILELLKPQVDWREVLREFIKNTCSGKDFSTWARPNRRFISQGVYLPSGISNRIGELVIAIDTSWSISNKEIARFLSEVVSICETVKPDLVRLLYWGSEVVGDEKYTINKYNNLAKSTNPRGGGGTDVNCVTEYMKVEKITPQAVVVLTDGDLYSGWSTWSCPVLWAIVDNPKKNPPTGKRVHLNSEDMR